VVSANHFDGSPQAAQATQGETWMENALGWKIDSLAAGKSLRREIVFKCTSETPRACDRVTVSARGIDELSEEICLEILTDQPEAEPAPAAGGTEAMKVSVAETADPVKVGSETTYQVLIQNQSPQSQF